MKKTLIILIAVMNFAIATQLKAQSKRVQPLSISNIYISQKKQLINKSNCETEITSSASIKYNSGGTITYQWLRSDGTTTPVQTLTLPNNYQSSNIYNGITDTWDLYCTNYSGWVQLKILSPFSIHSENANFNIECKIPQSSPISILNIQPISTKVDAISTSDCHKRVTFKARILYTGSGTLTYTWLRSDGTSFANITATLTDNNDDAIHSYDATTYWDVYQKDLNGDQPFNGWEALKVITPQSMISSNQEFTTSCTLNTPSQQNSFLKILNNKVSWKEDIISKNDCHIRYTFTANINYTGSGLLTYTWLRSDGVINPNVTTSLTDNNDNSVHSYEIATTWDVYQNNYHGWEALKVVSPQSMVSPNAEFNVNCPGVPAIPFTINDASVNITQNDLSNSNYCHVQVTCTANVQYSGSGNLTYSWLRSDGTSTSAQTISLPANATSKVITQTFDFYKNFSGWEALKITSPVNTNYSTNFTATCNKILPPKNGASGKTPSNNNSKTNTHQ